MNNRYKILPAFAIVYLVWGSTYLAIRVGVEYMPSALFGGTRYLSAGILMLLGLVGLRRPIQASGRDFTTLAAAGFLLLVGGNGLVILAEKTVPSGLASLVVATVPLWIAGLEMVLPGGERLSLHGMAGIVIGLLGLAVLSWPQLVRTAGQAPQLPGILTLLAASFCWAAGTLLVRRRPVALDAFAATAWEMVLGGAFNLIIGILLQGREPVVWNVRLLGALAYLAGFGSIVAFSAYIWLVQHVPAAKVATYAYVNPIVAVFLGWWLLSESVDAYVLGGMAIILLAVVLVTSARVRAAPANKTALPVRATLKPVEELAD